MDRWMDRRMDRWINARLELHSARVKDKKVTGFRPVWIQRQKKRGREDPGLR